MRAKLPTSRSRFQGCSSGPTGRYASCVLPASKMSTHSRAGHHAEQSRAAGALRRLARWLGEWGVPRAQALWTVVGLWLALAFVIAGLAFAGFVELASEVASGSTTAVDEGIMRWVGAHSTAGLDGFARSVTQLGSWLVMVVMALLVSVFLWIHGEKRAVALLWIGLAGVLLMDQTLKELFARARPQVFEWRTDRPGSYAFPSGHTLNATVGYTMFAFLVARLERSWALRSATFAVAALLIALVGASRVYLGVHFPTDVLAGMLIGFAWAMACVFAVYVLGDLRTRR
jgi:undecaprenyl-diphosphatase